MMELCVCVCSSLLPYHKEGGGGGQTDFRSAVLITHDLEVFKYHATSLRISVYVQHKSDSCDTTSLRLSAALDATQG